MCLLPRDDPRRNWVDNRPLAFGDRTQIEIIETFDAQMRGEISVGELEWEWSTWSGDLVFLAYVQCIRYHRHIQPRKRVPEYYDSLLTADEAVKEWECWNCGQEYVTFVDDDRSVYVKTAEPPE